jgi:hypothetical protein
VSRPRTASSPPATMSCLRVSICDCRGHSGDGGRRPTGPRHNNPC